MPGGTALDIGETDRADACRGSQNLLSELAGRYGEEGSGVEEELKGMQAADKTSAHMVVAEPR